MTFHGTEPDDFLTKLVMLPPAGPAIIVMGPISARAGRPNGTLLGVTGVEKVTVSLPVQLAACIEQRRTESGEGRSEVVADLCWRGWWQWDEEQRVRQSHAAYSAQPETLEEQAWAERAADTMAGWDSWDGPEAQAMIEDERADVLEKVRRLAVEPGASAFVSSLRQAIKSQPPARAAG